MYDVDVLKFIVSHAGLKKHFILILWGVLISHCLIFPTNLVNEEVQLHITTFINECMQRDL